MADDDRDDDANDRYQQRWPDPTALTNAAVLAATDLMRRETGALEDKLSERITGDMALGKARLEYLERMVNNRPSEIDFAVTHLKAFVESELRALADLSNEKFIGINNQFVQRDTAVQAALQAAKEAVGERNKSFSSATSKTGAYTGEQIKGLQTLIGATVQGYNTQIDDLKTRLAEISAALLSIQTVSAKVDSAHTSQLSSSGLIIAFGGLLVTVFVGVIGAASLVLSHVGAWK